MSRKLRMLRLACWMTLAGLALFVWSVLDPGPAPVMIAMSVGQLLGTIASVIFLFVVLADLRKLK